MAPPSHEELEVPRPGPSIRRILWVAGNTLAALWIMGATAFFLMRFSIVFYRANQAAIDNLLERIQR